MSEIVNPSISETSIPLPKTLAMYGPGSSAWSEAQIDARGKMIRRDPLRVLQGIVGFVDLIIIISFSLLSYIFRHGIEPVSREVIVTTIFAGLLSVNALSISKAYGVHIRDGFVTQSWRAVRAWTFVFVALMVIGYVSKILEDYSRVWAICWFFSVSFGLIAVRLVVVSKVHQWSMRGKLASTVAIVDLTNRGSEILHRLTENKSQEICLLGVFTSDPKSRPRSGIVDLIALSRLFRIDEVIVIISDQCIGIQSGELPSILRQLGTIPTNVRICPLLPDLGETPIRGTTLIHEIPMLTVHLRPLGAWNSIIKRAEDILIGTVALLILWPILLLVAIAIKIDSPGPVLFRQARQGFNNNIFTVLKFRSMTHDVQSCDSKLTQATKNDPRVTKLGRILRRTSLDELPQIFNVLIGEMSLVGPRPHATIHNEQYSALIDDYIGRHRVQPGITGWAQVNKLRGETETLDKMQKRVEFDLDYINNWSIGLDLKIIVLTAFLIVYDRQAY